MTKQTLNDIIQNKSFEKSKKNTAKTTDEACHYYLETFLRDVPLIAMVSMNNKLVPYEYTKDRVFRFKRSQEELDEHLSKELFPLLMFCFENKFNKKYLLDFVGGNLWDFIQMKKSFMNH